MGPADGHQQDALKRIARDEEGQLRLPFFVFKPYRLATWVLSKASRQAVW